MEDTLVEVYRKGFLYGFILGISLGLFTVPYKEVIEGSLEETNYFDLSDFIIPLLRVGVVVALVGAAIGFFLYKRDKKSLD